jgi:hypothetical protein
MNKRKKEETPFEKGTKKAAKLMEVERLNFGPFRCYPIPHENKKQGDGTGSGDGAQKRKNVS